MDSAELRVFTAGLLRELGHEFVAKELPDETLRHLVDHLSTLLNEMVSLPSRQRSLAGSSWEQFRRDLPEYQKDERKQLFADSIVSGGSNPMGLGAHLWRDGEQAVMEVTLGKAFEGAPERAHGGVVAALIDETMGLVLAIHEALAFTVQLNISYLAPTPINETLHARAWLQERDGRKLHMAAEVIAGDTTIATATSLFISVDPNRFLARE